MRSPDDPVTAENYTKLQEACVKLRHAEEGLQSAVARIQSAAMTWLHAEARCTDPGDRIPMLVSCAKQNASTWSGGPVNASNLIEAAKRSAALDLAHRLPFDLRGE